MKSSTALRQARELIESGRETFVCLALSFRVIGGADTQVYRRLNAIFTRGFSIDSWLKRESPRFRKFLLREHHGALYQDQLRLYRLRWIDWMIEGYEAVGD